MIWSEKTKEAVQDAIDNAPATTGWACTNEAQAALAAVAESDEWKAKDQEIERLKRQVSVLREAHVQTAHNLACERYVREHSEKAFAAADKIGEE